jgi:hypothetical protein
VDLDKTISPTACHLPEEIPQFSACFEVNDGTAEGLQMSNEGCPNEDPNSDDATGYSQGEEEAFADETLPEVQEPISSR